MRHSQLDQIFKKKILQNFEQRKIVQISILHRRYLVHPNVPENVEER